MRFRDLLKMARENLFRRKLRTSLTILSIVIGTVSIVLMIALGLGIQQNVRKEFDAFGSLNVLDVSKGQAAPKTNRFNEATPVSGLTDDDVTLISKVSGIDAVAPNMQVTVKLITKSYQAYVNVIGFDPALLDEMGFSVATGRLLSPSGDYELLLGDKALESFTKIKSDNVNASIQRPDENTDTVITDDFGYSYVQSSSPVDPLKERFKLTLDTSYGEEQPTTVDGQNNSTSDATKATQAKKYKLYGVSGVGVLKAGDMNKDYAAYMPLTTVERLLKDYTEANGQLYKRSYSKIQVKVHDLNQVTEVQHQLEGMGYSVFSLMSVLDSVNKTLGVLQIALGAIGGISLFVAAIGITNTMVMAITERKKEIGIMKVIGATVRDIKYLFLIESALIGLIGGVIGIILCVLLSLLISSPAFSAALSGGGGGPGFSFSIPPWLIGEGLVFTTLIGIVSGYLPARKAMRSSALEAIRNE